MSGGEAAKCGNCGEENDRPGCYLCSECDELECPCCGQCVMVVRQEIYCFDGCKLKWHERGSLHLGEGCGCDEFGPYTEEDKGEQAKMRAQIEKWLADGNTWIGIYEHNVLGDEKYRQHRIALPYDMWTWDKAQLGEKAPDTGHGPGWKYALIAKCKSADEAILEMKESE